MIFIYNISIILLEAIFKVGRFFNYKIALGYNGRKNWKKQLEVFNKTNNSKVIWFHCASLGEFEMARPVIEELNKNHKDEFSIAITFFSPSGYEIRKNYNGAKAVFYLPFDTIKNSNDFIKLLNPQIAIFVKYEFWLNYLSVLKRNKIKTILINAIFDDEQIYFKWYGKIYLNALMNFDHIFVQTRKSLKKLNQKNINKVSVSGDLRYDRVIANSKLTEDFDEIRNFAQNTFTIIGGSTWQAEEYILKYCIQNSDANIKLIIAPHDISENHLISIEKLFENFGIARLSNNNVTLNTKVLIIDSIGKLSSIYKYGNAALVGGGFSGALHNIIEPAVFGIPVFFGYKFSKFPEAVYFKKNKIGFSIHNGFYFTQYISEIIKNNHLRNEIKIHASSVFKANTGSTMQVYYKIISYLK